MVLRIKSAEKMDGEMSIACAPPWFQYVLFGFQPGRFAALLKSS
jgi:hypothetical protein